MESDGLAWISYQQRGLWLLAGRRKGATCLSEVVELVEREVRESPTENDLLRYEELLQDSVEIVPAIGVQTDWANRCLEGWAVRDCEDPDGRLAAMRRVVAAEFWAQLKRTWGPYIGG